MFIKQGSAARTRAHKHQAGVAATELAIILPVMIALIAFPLFFGRVYMHYSVAQKAAHNAATYLAKLPLIEMQDVAKSAAATTLTQDLIDSTVDELQPGNQGVVVTQVQCDDGPCGSGVPTTVTVHVRVRMYDEFFNYFTGPVVGDEGVHLKAKVTMKYVGA